MYITYTYNIMRCDIRGFRSCVAEDLYFLVTDIIELLNHEHDGTTILRNVANYVAKNKASRTRRRESSVSSISPSVFRQLYLHVKIYRTQYTKLGRL